MEKDPENQEKSNESEWLSLKDIDLISEMN